MEGRVAAAQPVRLADKKEQATYVRYTPAQQGTAFNSGSKQSIIRMVDVQKDPMEPPRYLLLIQYFVQYLFFKSYLVFSNFKNYIEI